MKGTQCDVFVIVWASSPQEDPGVRTLRQATTQQITGAPRHKKQQACACSNAEQAQASSTHQVLLCVLTGIEKDSGIRAPDLSCPALQGYDARLRPLHKSTEIATWQE